MKRTFFLPIIVAAFSGASAHAEFIGELAFRPEGCNSSATCTIVSDFKYIDPNKIGWLTKAGDLTDGASIPQWAQPFIGKPFDKLFIKAAVIHDHYCDRHVRPWRQTHRVFYDVLVESGLDIAKAKLMYFAVYLAGPKWVELIRGNSCGPGCEWMRAVSVTPEATRGLRSTNNLASENAPKDLIMRAAEYDNPQFNFELREAEKLINESGGKASLSALEERAKAIKPNDFYYTHNDTVSEDTAAKTQPK
jgi:hypothetical protein